MGSHSAPAAAVASPSWRYQAIDLAISIAGIYICYIYYAFLQEHLTTAAQPDGSKFRYPLFLMLVQCVFNCACVWPLMMWKERRAASRAAAAAAALKALEAARSPHAPVLVSPASAAAAAGPPRELGSRECRMQEHHYALLALSYLLGMVSSYVALDFISYPTQVLIKSCKMLPVMALGSLVFRQRYSALEYLAVAMISAGIFAFFAFKDQPITVTSGGAEAPLPVQNSTGGVVLSMFSLLCDGITGSGQDHYVAKYHPSSELLMYSMNKYAVLELLVGCFALTSQGFEGFSFLVGHPSLVGQVAVFGCVSAVGQLFIFHLVTTFGALPLSIATSTRKFVTILASVLYFGHALNTAQWLSVGAVFGGLFCDIAKKAVDKNSRTKAAKHKLAHAQHAKKVE